MTVEVRIRSRSGDIEVEKESRVTVDFDDPKWGERVAEMLASLRERDVKPSSGKSE